jgi:hypothetical protein
MAFFRVNPTLLKSDVQHVFNVRRISLRYQSGLGQISLLLSFLLGKDVAFERMLTLNFSSSGKLETLFGTGICFHFRHNLLV